MCNEKKVPGCGALSMRRLHGRPHHWQQLLLVALLNCWPRHGQTKMKKSRTPSEQSAPSPQASRRSRLITFCCSRHGGATGELRELQEYLEALLTDLKRAPELSIPEHLANKPFDSTASRAWKKHMANQATDEMALKSKFEHMFAPLKLPTVDKTVQATLAYHLSMVNRITRDVQAGPNWMNKLFMFDLFEASWRPWWAKAEGDYY